MGSRAGARGFTGGFMITRMSKHLCRLGNRHFGHYLLGRQEAILIECGVSSSIGNLAADWRSLSDPPTVKSLVVMHAHFDHVCGIPGLKARFPHAPVLASQAAQAVLSKPKVVKGFFQQDRQMRRRLAAEGILPPDPAPQPPECETLPVEGTLSEGDRLTIDGHIALQVMEAPGHSPCSLALYEPDEQILFVSDAGGFQISDDRLFPVFFHSYPEYIRTIKRLMALPTRILAIPHERVWMGEKQVQAFFQRALSAAQQGFAEIAAMLAKGMDQTKMEKRLFDRYYQGDLRIYTPENIGFCIQLLIRRTCEALEAGQTE